MAMCLVCLFVGRLQECGPTAVSQYGRLLLWIGATVCQVSVWPDAAMVCQARQRSCDMHAATRACQTLIMTSCAAMHACMHVRRTPVCCHTCRSEASSRQRQGENRRQEGFLLGRDSKGALVERMTCCSVPTCAAAQMQQADSLPLGPKCADSCFVRHSGVLIRLVCALAGNHIMQRRLTWRS